MKRILEYVWPVVGLIAVCASIYLLYREFKGESVGPAVWADLKAIPSHRYALAALSTLGIESLVKASRITPLLTIVSELERRQQD